MLKDGKAFHFYFLSESFNESRDKIINTIARDLNKVVQSTEYNLSIYRTSDSQIYAGVVYVNTKIWPKNARALKNINEAKIHGGRDVYVTNKQNSLISSSGNNKKLENVSVHYDKDICGINL